MQTLTEEVLLYLHAENVDDAVRVEYLERIPKGKLTRDENKETHICVYFAAFDPLAKKVFLGLHIKSGLWLFNGGHVDKGELLQDALLREMTEEWGFIRFSSTGSTPNLFTITYVANPNLDCKVHYDVWYFIPVSHKTFSPDEELLATEFTEMRWLTPDEAMELTKDPSTQIALKKFKQMFE